MPSASFRISSRSLTLAVSLGVAVLVSAAAPPIAPVDEGAQLGGIIRAALAQAPGNFAIWHAGVKSVDAYGVTFKSSAALKRICPLCSVGDEYASADSDERYALTVDWPVPKSWSRAQTLAFIQTHIGELLPAFSAQQGTRDSGASWFDWTKGSPKEFVYVTTFSGSSGNGIEVRVGHYLQKNSHFTLYARLNSTQRSDLAKEVRNFVQLGIQNVSDNFSSLRGRATDKDKNYFDTNVSLGEFMKSCTVDGIFANLSSGGGTGKWILECDTPSLGGSKSDVEAIIRSAIAGALPDSYSVTSDAKYLGNDDYRWDRSSDSAAVMVSAYDNSDGTFDYHVEVYHFTS